MKRRIVITDDGFHKIMKNGLRDFITDILNEFHGVESDDGAEDDLPFTTEDDEKENSPVYADYDSPIVLQAKIGVLENEISILHRFYDEARHSVRQAISISDIGKIFGWENEKEKDA